MKKKKQPKWFQKNTSSTTTITTETTEKNSPVKTNIAPETTPPTQSLKEIFLEDLYKFKEEGLYEEALASIQSIFEVDGVDVDLLYEAADIYFLMDDYRRAANCLKNFLEVKPTECRGHLLQAQIFLETGKKEEALSTVENIFKRQIQFTKPAHYEVFDKIIERLKKIFKADKLFRRCPQLADYQKKRRQMLKTATKTISATPSNAVNLQNSPKFLSKETTITNMETLTNNKINTKLTDTISHIWDMQSATTTEKNIILAASKEELNHSILNQVLSYKKKIWLYNFFANIFQQNSNQNTTNLDTAIYLLRQALLLDDEDDLLLKNLGYLLYKKGELNAAKVVLEDISLKDFATEELIRNCQN